MKGTFQLGAVLLMAAGSCVLAQRAPAKGARPAPPRAAGMRPDAPKGGGLKAGGAHRLPNPANPVQRLLQMSPEQRERALEQLPPMRQERIRQALEHFDRLPPAEKERRLRVLNTFSNLPPETQNLLRRQIQAFNNLSDERREMVGWELRRLSRLPESDRRSLIASEEFKGRFSPSEQQMLVDLSENYPFPGR